jgi:putative membrane protein
MINLLLRLTATMLSIKGADLLLTSFNLHGGWRSVFIFSAVVGILNWLVKPILVFFSFPFLILTIGLFYLVINAAILYLASLIVPGVLEVTLSGILLGSFLISVFQWFLSALFRTRKRS